MIQTDTITWWNTALPLAILALLSVLVPILLVPRGTRSQKEVAVTIWASAGVMLIAGACVFAMIYWVQGIDIFGASGGSIRATISFFLRQSGFAALLWAPILVLMWLYLAQAVEKRKGEDISRGFDK